MRKLLNKIFAPFLPPVFSEDEDKTRKAMYAHWMAYALLIGVIAFEVWARTTQGYTDFALMDLLLVGIMVVCAIGLVRLRTGHIRFISVMLVVLVWAAANGMATGFGVKDVTYLTNFAIILMAGMLLSWRAAMVVTVLSIASGFALAWAEQSGQILVDTYPITSFAGNIAMVLGVYAVFIWLLIGGLENALKRSRSSVEELASANAILNYTQTELQNRSTELIDANKELENRTQKLHGIAEVARITTSIHSFDQLLPAITNAISEQLGYYQVGLFLLDEEKRYAILRSASTVAGQRMLNRGYRVAVGSINPIGYIAQTGQPRVTRSKESDSTFLGNVDFPETRSQVVLPLGGGDNIIGVLDIQSREANVFSQDDLATLSILSDQVAIAIENALLYERSQTALREADIASRGVSNEAWAEYGKTIQTRGYRYDGIKSEPLKDMKLSRRESDFLSIPVQLRDQTIGCLKLKSSDPSREWTDDELTMAKLTAERVALALEGARLLDEAQKRAKRESFLSEVTAKLGTSFQLDSILRDTVEELGLTLKNSTVTFQLVNPSIPHPPEPQNLDGTATDKKTVE